MNLELLKKYSYQHGAKIIPFEELINGINKEIFNKYINVSAHPLYPQLKIYKYANKTVYERYWNKFTILSRGLIIDDKDKRVIATPFIKFFNYDEIEDIQNIFTKDFNISEKIDGSLGILFYYKKEWHIASSGSFTSRQAVKAIKMLHNKVNIDKLNNSFTYIIEIVYPQNRIVIPYANECLYLLAIFDENGYEINSEDVDTIALKIDLKRPKKVIFNNIDEAIKTTKRLPYDEEGHVIRFSNGIRIKIKGLKYLEMHKLISDITPVRIWTKMLQRDYISFTKIPEEYRKECDKIRVGIHQERYKVLNDLENLYRKTFNKTNKEIGLYIKNNKLDDYNKKLYNLLFSRRRSNFFKEFNEPNSKIRKSIYKLFKPENN